MELKGEIIDIDIYFELLSETPFFLCGKINFIIGIKYHLAFRFLLFLFIPTRIKQVATGYSLVHIAA